MHYDDGGLWNPDYAKHQVQTINNFIGSLALSRNEPKKKMKCEMKNLVNLPLSADSISNLPVIHPSLWVIWSTSIPGISIGVSYLYRINMCACV